MKKLYSIVASAIIGAFSFTANAQNELVYGDVKVGDLITLSDGSQWYVGSNEVTNGSFDMDPSENNNAIVGWTIAKDYAQMTTSQFAWYATGGYDGGAYIQATGHTGAGGDKSVGQRWPLQQNTRYYFSFYLAKNSANNQYIPVITLTDKESTGGGQNEEAGKYIIGMSGDSSDGCLGFANFKDEDGDGVGEWAQTACSFVSGDNTWLQFNARWLKENKIQACFDGFFLAKLYDPAEMTAEEVAFMALQATINDAYSFAENQLGDYESLASELGDFIQEGGFEELTESASLEELQAAIDALKAKVESYKAVLPMINAFQSRYDEAMGLLEAEVCPEGTDALEEVLQTLGEWIENGYPNESEDMSAEAYIQSQLDVLNKAIASYYSTATPGTDLSSFINNPTFEVQGKWYIGQGGGDQRVKSDFAAWPEETITSSWNAWRNNLNKEDQYVSISQELSNLPNGYYTVSAYMITQLGCITDQHVFATSPAQEVVSPVMTKEGWDASEWELLTTDKVLVMDGRLTIGAIGHGADRKASEGGGPDDNRCGWFCVTGFKLTYQGAATDEDIAAAVANKFAEAEARTLSFAADNETYKAAVAEAKATSDLDALKAAIAEADASDAEYKGVLTGSYAQLQDSIANSTLYSANAKKLAQMMVDHMTAYLASAEATYKETPAKTALQRYFLTDMIPTLQKAEKAAEEATNAEAKAFINDAIANYMSALSTYVGEQETLTALKNELEEVLHVATLLDVPVADGADLTAYIANSTITDNNAAGWTVNRYVGNTNTAGGQEYNSTSGRYLDTWDGTPGKTRCTWYQVLSVPNGKYTFKAMVRTSGEGAYLFAADKAPVKVTEDDGTEAGKEVEVLPADAAIVLSESVAKATPNAKYGIASEEEETAYTDQYGEIWMAAADRVIAALGITPIEGTSIYDLAIDANDGSEDCPANVDANDWEVIKMNGGKGRGWFYNSLEVEVKDHTLVIGMSCDTKFLGEQAKPWAGTWLSGDNFTLTLDKAGDNAGWNPALGIEAVETVGAQATEIYTVGGVRTNALTKGINIVKMSNGTVVKIAK